MSETLIWTQSDTLALAQQHCVQCFGLGLIQSREKHRPCHCVERAIFRACYRRFEECAATVRFSSSYYSEVHSARNRRAQAYGFRNEEFLADFVLTAKRVLGVGSLGWRVFNYHFLLGADWKLCVRKLGGNRGEFFHEVYRVEQKLGRAFKETAPHALYPLDEYFGGTIRGAKREPLALPLARPPLRAPLKQVARQAA